MNQAVCLPLKKTEVALATSVKSIFIVDHVIPFLTNQKKWDTINLSQQAVSFYDYNNK